MFRWKTYILFEYFPFFLPEGPFCKLGEVVVAEVDFHQDLQVVESTLVDCLVVSF